MRAISHHTAALDRQLGVAVVSGGCKYPRLAVLGTFHLYLPRDGDCQDMLYGHKISLS
jgi:hypothetical protein